MWCIYSEIYHLTYSSTRLMTTRMDTRKELLDGLKSTPKYIPSWYRYDKEGSRLNDMCLQENENYYFHRCELNVLKAHLSSMLTFDTEKTDLVDMGSGNCQKTRLFIDNILQNHDKLTFYPVDISHEFLSDTCRQLSEEYAEKLEIKPIPADYETGISEIRACIHPKLILWFGSIQSLEPDDQIRKLQLLRSSDDRTLLFDLQYRHNTEQRRGHEGIQ
ncbi:histidine N-alpha-methyltransferase-like isoform X2 [Pecten maximus]|uniref:histidine N-alpha-methyltransferase-like isoform X2 n=1 Tax=Pecten maximus TaxID=6579 RepID=UPI0014580EBE|nr:histidine N-alpha-methyltransferase-like isoform X2 [Pecten maximus]